MTEDNISSGSSSANWALSKQTLPWLLLFLLLQEDLVHRVGLGVQGGPDLPLVQSHQLVPKITKEDMSSWPLLAIYIKGAKGEGKSATHLRSNDTWRTRWASLALESLCVSDRNNSHHSVPNDSSCWNFHGFSLTVSPLCPGCPGSPSFPAGPWSAHETTGERNYIQCLWWCCRLTLNSQVGPLVLGNLSVPEGLADPKSQRTNNYYSIMT